MRLTAKEKAQVAGKDGLLVQLAMQFLVTLGEAFDAEEMVEIAYANIILGSSFWGKGIITQQLVAESVEQGLKVKVPTTFNNWGLWDPQTPDTIWDDMEVPISIRKQILWENEIAIRMGIDPTCTCAPYLLKNNSTDLAGKYISTIESSAIVFYNSVLGARANRDCVASFFAAITGKYPKCGVFLDENRLGEVHFDVMADVNDPITYGTLGIFAGRIAGKRIPVFTGISQPERIELMALSAALASSGAVSMFHIIGVTPEANDLEKAFGSKKHQVKQIVSQRDLDLTHTLLSDKEGQVDFVCLGCPHYSLSEIADVAALLDGRKINPSVTLWVCTAPDTAKLSEKAGYYEKIRKAGGIIMSGPNFCPVFGPGKPCPEYAFRNPEYSVGNFATDSAKQAFYAKSNLRAKNVFLGDREHCIDAAISGYWKGQSK